MIVTAGILALAGIAGTALGAAVGPVSNTLMRRGDRRHETKVKFEDRAWEEKNAALIDIIRKVSAMRQACERESSWGPQGISEEIQFARMRVRALRVYHDTRTDFVPPELLAYGAKPVCNLVQELEQMLKAHYTVATTVNLNQLENYIKQSLEQDDPNDALRLARQAQDMEDTLGTGSDLNVHELRSLCDQVLVAANKDLRGN